MSKALLCAGVFGLSTLVAVLVRFCEERLGLLWREWLTRWLIDAYFAGHRYERLTEAAGVDNPDQRIVEDARGLAALVANMKRIIAVNRNVSFFTTGYSYGIQLIPAVIVGPLFIRGKVEFGVIPQSAMAFSHLLGAFSLVVTQYGSITSYAAVLARLRALRDAAERTSAPGGSRIEIVDGSERLAWERLTLRTPEADQVLIAGLTAAVEPRSRWLVTGPNSAAQAALVRATAGLWRSGEGRILRPEKIAFLPESPYLPPSTLGVLLVPPGEGAAQSRARVARLLEPLGLAELVERAGGLDRVTNATLNVPNAPGQKMASGGFDAVLGLELDGTWRLSLNRTTAEQGISKPPG